ncbi:MAG: PhoU domain-containing protein [bacterium]|nr:PhoU domain-containing protein [bacterium]
MLRELLALFRSREPLREMGADFTQMLALGLDLVRKAGDAFFQHSITPARHKELRKQDVKINKLQRRIRKQVLFHLSVESNSMDLPYCLVLMSLVKDIERIGDYAKDLADLVPLTGNPLPADELRAQLSEVRIQVEKDFQTACEILESGDQERAVTLIQEGRTTVDLCEALVNNVAGSQHSADSATALALATRFYARIAGHVLNLLSGVVMPLHKLDYFDEDYIAEVEEAEKANG